MVWDKHLQNPRKGKGKEGVKEGEGKKELSFPLEFTSFGKHFCKQA